MNVKLEEDAVMPSYAKEGDAGLDLSALQDTHIPAGACAIIRTGVAVEIPVNHFGALVGRSGLAAQGVLCHFGTIDSGYRGNLGVIMFNTNPTQFIIKKGTRIAQLIIQEYTSVGLKQVDELGETDRGETVLGVQAHEKHINRFAEPFLCTT